VNGLEHPAAEEFGPGEVADVFLGGSMPRKSVEALEQEVARLAAENGALREGLEEFRKLMEEAPASETEDGFDDALCRAWYRAETMVGMLVCTVILRMWLYVSHEHFWINNICCGFAAIVFLHEWNEREYQKNGFIQLLMKWFLFGLGAYLAVALLLVGGCEWWFAGAVLVVFGLLTISKLTVTIAEYIKGMGEEAMEIKFVARVMGWLI
jgi:hypothetical protein